MSRETREIARLLFNKEQEDISRISFYIHKKRQQNETIIDRDFWPGIPNELSYVNKLDDERDLITVL